MSLIALGNGDYDMTGWSCSAGAQLSGSALTSVISSFNSLISGASALSGLTSLFDNDIKTINCATAAPISYTLGWQNAPLNSSGGLFGAIFGWDNLTLDHSTLDYSVAEGSGLSNLYQAVVGNIDAANCCLQGTVSIQSISTTGTSGFVDFDAQNQILSYSADGYTGSGPDSFTYTAQDAYGHTVTGTVDINVTQAANTAGTTPAFTTLVPGGTSGSDFLFVTTANQRAVALGGDDTIFATASGDAVYAGSGNDMVFLSGDHQTVYGGSGHDTLTLTGATNADVILPASTVGFDDVYSFNAASDKIDLSNVLAGTKYNGCNLAAFVKVSTVTSGSTTDMIISVNPSGSCCGQFNAVADLHGVALSAGQLSLTTSNVTNALAVAQTGGGSNGGCWWL